MAVLEVIGLIILLITALVYLIVLVFDIDPPEKETQVDSWLGAAVAVASAVSESMREPTLKERLMKPFATIMSKKIGIFALIVSAVMLILYAYRFITWFFQTLWMIVTSKTFLLIVAILFTVAALFFIVRAILSIKEEKENKRLWERNRSLEDEIRDTLSMPVPVGAVSNANFEQVSDQLDSFKAFGERPDEISKLEWFDKRLHFFYDLSIRAEAGSSAAYEEFEKALAIAQDKGNPQILRTDVNESRILQNQQLKQERKITEFKKDLDDDRVSPLFEQLQAVAEQDTSGLFGLLTSSKKVQRKTEQLKALYDAACSEVQELKDTASGINEILKYSRLCAYRNIYLGAELLNYIRDNAGGKKLKTAGDSLNLDFDLEIVGFDRQNLSVDGIGIIESTVMDTLNYYGRDRDALAYASENPKGAALELGLKMIGNYLSDRAEKIDNNLEIQKKIMEAFPKVVEGYLEGKADTLRAIEVIRAIIHTNKGFIKVYAPLRDKLFNEGVTPTQKELQQLVLVTKDFNKINNTEL